MVIEEAPAQCRGFRVCAAAWSERQAILLQGSGIARLLGAS